MEFFMNALKTIRNLCIFLVFFTCVSGAYEIGCVEGEIVERTAKFKEIIQTFRFSKDCTLRDEKELAILMKGPGYVNLEVYWPGLISYKRMTELSKKNMPTEAQMDYIRSFITLSYGPTSLMISSAIDEYHMQKNYEIIKEDDEYGYYIKKYKTTPSKTPIHKTIFIAPKLRKDFWVMCMKKQCFLMGIVGKVKYELNMQTEKTQNWSEIHETMNAFVTKIQLVSK